MDDQTRAAIGPALGRVPSGVFIVTAGDGKGNETGMLTSWIQQASFEPPVVTLAVNQKRYLNEWLAATGKVAISIVGETQKELLAHFGRGFEPDEPAFEGINVKKGETGLPVLADALGYLEGKVVNHAAAGDHVIYFIELTGGGMTGEAAPMVHIRKNGFGY